MTLLVLDASVTMAWCFRDEGTDYADTVFDKVRDTGALVPPIWPLEIVNVLVVGERRRRLTEADTARFLRALDALRITIDIDCLRAPRGQLLAVAREQRLSAYDASYLELAMRRGTALATLDRDLAEAATRVGVPLV